MSSKTNPNNAEKRPTPPEGLPKANNKPDLTRMRKAMSWRAIDTPAYRYILLVTVATLLALLVTPSLFSTTPSYDDQMLNQVATSDIRSPADLNIEDLAATEKKREEVERSTHPIYDYHPQLSNEIQVRIDEAFSAARTRLYEFILHQVVEPEIASTKPKSTENKIDPNAPAAENNPEELAGIRQQKLKEIADNIETYIGKINRNKTLAKDLKSHVLLAHNDFNKTIQAVVPESNYLDLFNNHFSIELSNALKSMIGDVMSRKIINEKELMERGEDGLITIRIVDNASKKTAQYDQRDLSGILDLKEVNRSLWRYTTILSDLGNRQRELLLRVGAKLVQPNLAYNRNLTIEHRRHAREAVKAMFIPIKKGEVIIRDGMRFEQRHLVILRAIENEIASTNPLLSLLAYFIFFFLVLYSLIFFASRNIRKFKPEAKDYTAIAFLTLLFILMVKAVSVVANALDVVLPSLSIEAYYLAIPVAAGGAMVRIMCNSETAYVFIALISLLFGMLTNNPVFMSTYALVTSLIAADAVGQCRTRATLFLAGMRASLVAMLMVLFHSMVQGNLVEMSFLHLLLAAFISGMATGLVLTGMTPVIEFIFNYTTDIKLLELANLNHPLLKKLIVQAPGTYHHSILVGSLVEAAAESIHANPLLARVAAYYHDIGKVKNPLYFAENQREGQNPHDTLNPNMSVLILLSHVKEGAELARKHNLGEKITWIIQQHHGTNLIRFFHHKALEMHEKGDIKAVDERDFRYPGPKPQTLEAGLVMLADSVEAATRSLNEPTPERVQGTVQRVINMIFRDEQLNECELTLKDLHLIARSFTQILIGIYHNRPVYPGSKQQEKPQDARSNPQPPAQTHPDIDDVEDTDDKDIKRLGMH